MGLHHRLIIILLLLPTLASAAERTRCRESPISDGKQWAYRQQVDGNPRQCWYQGERGRDRALLHWTAPDYGPLPTIVDDLSDPPPRPDGFRERWQDVLVDLVPAAWLVPELASEWRMPLHKPQ
jgi:hypothetical protein